MLPTTTPLQAAQDSIAEAFREFGPGVPVLTSLQREGVVIVDLAQKIAPGAPVMIIDTGRLPEATLDMVRTIEQRYSISVERILPDPSEVQAMVSSHGPDLFRDGYPQRVLCCQVRKVRPLASRMANVPAFFAGLRRSQSDTRSDTPVVDRSASPVKICPLADWSAEDVLRYSRENALPEHPLYSKGYTSIGCDPCTRAVSAGEDERAGRWWWETEADKECGIHFTPEGKVERRVDVLLREILERASV